MAFQMDFLLSYDKDSIIAELQRVAKKLRKKTLTHDEINRHGRLCGATVSRKWGSMQLALEAAGLKAARPRLSKSEIMKALADLWAITLKESGRSPSGIDARKHCFPVSMGAVRRQFGSWNKALAAVAAASPGKLMKATPLPGKVKKRRAKITIRKQFTVFQRDGYRCQMCRRVGGKLHLDHVIPVSKGGSSRMDNLQTLCQVCNLRKGAKLL